MKKTLLLITVTVLSTAALTGCGKKSNSNASNSATTAKSSSSAHKEVTDACKIFTPAIATQVVGAGAVQGDSPAGATSSDDITVSTCTYLIKASDISAIKDEPLASILVRSAKTSTGEASNKAVFTPAAEPAGSEKVSGYGDAAYWNPTLGQLNILEHGNWYIISNGHGALPAGKTLDEAKQLADALKANL